MTDERGGEPDHPVDERVDPSSDEGPVSMKFRVVVAIVGLLILAGIVASFLVRPDADGRSAAEPTRANADTSSNAADADADVDEELRDVRDLRVDGVAVEMPAGWTIDSDHTEPDNAAFRHRDGHLVTVGIAEFAGRGPRTDDALVEEMVFLAESLEDASPVTSFDFDDPLVDSETDVRRAFLYGTRTEGSTSTRVRIAISYNADVGRMLFVTLFVDDPLLADRDVEAQLLDLIPGLEVDAFDPDASFEPAPST